jgi:thiamine-phosphate pyrophosphorylase
MIRCAIADSAARPEDAARWSTQRLDYVQLRDKRLPAGELVTLARTLLPHLGATQLLINGRPDVALASGAAGVHLTSAPGELTPAQVREVFSLAQAAPPILSVSCHTLDEVRRAHQAAVDLILFGPVFEKRVARQLIRDGSGLALLREACQAAASTPVLALGGITEDNTADCLEAGAAGIAAIRLFQA